ncbi:MAG: rod shape-determining protein MreD [Burkholderiales bacterium]
MEARARAPQLILLPVRTTFIVVTFALALALNLLPWTGFAVLVKPDFVALVVLYWCVEQPRKVGFLTAWALGLVMDVADGALFGQHALAYTVLAFAAIVLHRRIQGFPMRHQFWHVLALLTLNQLIVLGLRMAAGAPFPGIAYFLPALLGALLWAPLSALMRMPRIPKSDPDQI